MSNKFNRESSTFFGGEKHLSPAKTITVIESEDLSEPSDPKENERRTNSMLSTIAHVVSKWIKRNVHLGDGNQYN